MDNTYELNIQSSAADMYEQYTRYSYTEWYALAEFIDNSTASFYLHEDNLIENGCDRLIIEINYDKTTNTLTIEDNAFGMEREEFDRALVAGKKPTFIGRNEFGYGLKTAATWFGRHWSVESSQLGSDVKYFGYIDLDELHSSGKNEIPVITEPEKTDLHYTKITIQRLVRPLSTVQIKNKIIKVLNSMYRRDLVSGKIEILYNGTKLAFEEYEPLFFRGQVWKKDISFSFECLGKLYEITGFVGIHAKGGYNKTGFALLRNNRVIIDEFKPKEIFVQSQSYISKNLYGELNMESFSVNQAKDGFSWTSEVQEAFIVNLKEAINDYIKVAKISNADRIAEEKAKDEPEETSVKEDKTEHKKQDEKPASKKDDTSISSGEVKMPVVPVKAPEEKISEEKNAFDVTINAVSYNVVWKVVDNKFFLYFFDKDTGILTINLNHSFAKNCRVDSRYDVSKLLLAYVCSESAASKVLSVDGYVTTSQLRNTLNKFLAE